MKSLTTALSAAALFALRTSADAISFCSTDDVCFGLAIPEAVQSAGSGNVYFQLRAPTSYAWVAIGTGTRMSGSTMLVMYQDGNGNVTVSPRTTSGHDEPELDSDVDVTLLEGSGVSSGEMVANVQCASCGSILTLDGTQSFISAWKSGSMSSTSQSASISRHDSHWSAAAQLGQATVATDANPFTSSDSGSSSNGNDNGNGDGDDGGNSGNSSNGNGNVIVGSSGGGGGGDNRAPAHGIIMALVFVALYPIGAFLMPLLGKWMAHAGFQTLVFIAMWVGFGLGYALAQDFGMLFLQSHTLLGTVVCSLMAVQPILGFLHHRYYLKHQARGIISHVHIWYGRILIVLGIVNGGLGLEMARASNSAKIAYIVLAVFFPLLYAVIVVFRSFRRKSPAPQGKKSAAPEYSQA